MDFRLLGPLEISAGHAQLQIAAGRQRALLAILLLHANRTVSRDRVLRPSVKLIVGMLAGRRHKRCR